MKNELVQGIETQNFDDKDKISLQKIDKISGPSKDTRDQALGWGIRVYLSF